MSFPAGVNEVIFTVPIHDEGRFEPDETFYIDLEIPSAAANRGVIKGDVASATVTILNDDGECSSSALCTTMDTN